MTGQTILDLGVRSDLAAAHADTAADLARAGDWLTGAERAAVVAVVRAARAEADQPPWYRPSADHAFEPLASAAVDAVWRLTNHPGTLTADWYHEIVDQLPSGEYYVELMGVTSVVNAMDRLASILDVDPLDIPEAESGNPARPDIDLSITSHWVPTAADFAGPNVMKALSASPAAGELRNRIGSAQYMAPGDMMDFDWSRGTIDRRQIELIAGVTSLHNECFY